MNTELFYSILMANIISGIIHTIIFYGTGILIAYVLYRKNRKLLKKLKKVIKVLK